MSRMLRITNQDATHSLKLEGSVSGPWVEELQKTWSAISGAVKTGRVTVDLAAVSFVDDRGRQLLLHMQKAGALLKEASPFLQQVLDLEAEKNIQAIQKRKRK
jgi:hypothetical protein